MILMNWMYAIDIVKSVEAGVENPIDMALSIATMSRSQFEVGPLTEPCYLIPDVQSSPELLEALADIVTKSGLVFAKLPYVS